MTYLSALVNQLGIAAKKDIQQMNHAILLLIALRQDNPILLIKKELFTNHTRLVLSASILNTAGQTIR